MSRRQRMDYAGAWHHVMNRGIARRTVFEGRRDVERFLRGVAEERVAGRLEVHAYTCLTTHFHLLVRSPVGELPEAMRRIQNGYVRAFNRERKRDGALFRGRYSSRVVESDAYFGTLIRYIDLNAVEAALAGRARDYPFCSAWDYTRSEETPWLVRDVVCARYRSPGKEWDPGQYPDWNDVAGLSWVASVVERRMRSRSPMPDPWDDLVRMGSLEVQSWMLMKSRLADGTNVGLAIVSAEGVARVVRSSKPGSTLSQEGESRIRERLLVGLLRAASGLPIDEVATMCGRSTTWVRIRMQEHARAMEDDAYASLAATAMTEVLQAEAGRFGEANMIPVFSAIPSEPTSTKFPHRSREAGQAPRARACL